MHFKDLSVKNRPLFCRNYPVVPFVILCKKRRTYDKYLSNVLVLYEVYHLPLKIASRIAFFLILLSFFFLYLTRSFANSFICSTFSGFMADLIVITDSIISMLFIPSSSAFITLPAVGPHEPFSISATVLF